MRILVLSDSHGREQFALKAIESQPTVNVVIHLGDGADDLVRASSRYQTKLFIQVAGNNDYCSILPYDRIAEFDNVKLFCTHGHTHNVKYSLEDLKNDAKRNGCQILLYGHTHDAVVDYEDGLYILNPGSVGGIGLGGASYGIIDITPSGIVCNVIKLQF